MKVAAYLVALVTCLASSANAASYVIDMKFNEDTGKVFFEPRRLEISLGDKVTWIQRDGDNKHNVVSYPSRIPAGTETFESPMLQRPGTSWSMIFDKSGTYEYHCHPHEAIGMRGMIIVGRESLPHEFRRSKAGKHKRSSGDAHHDQAPGSTKKPSGHHAHDGDAPDYHRSHRN